jgi:hypothetical protein
MHLFGAVRSSVQPTITARAAAKPKIAKRFMRISYERETMGEYVNPLSVIDEELMKYRKINQ